MTAGKISDFTAGIMTAFSNCALYSNEHPVFIEFSERAFGLLKDLFSGDALRVTLLGENLVFNDDSLAEKGIHFVNFAKRLKKKGIEKIEIRRGTTIDEFRKFLAGMASKNAFPGSPHISVGIVEVSLRDGGVSLGELIEENITKIKDAYQGISTDTGLNIASLEEAVTGLISSLKREANVLRLLSPVNTYNEYTYVHAANVSVLTIFQAEAFGMSEETIYDIGLAGLLHDVGKLFVSTEVLDKPSKLEPDEWDIMKLHPVYGAKYLSTLPSVPKLAMIIAFEHHMKYNGSGYPDSKKTGNKQNLISQMVAISDFFDALRTERPYKKAVEVNSIVKLMIEGAGKDFNTVLLDNFIGALRDIKTI